jgi:diketogulonate reductase-like aldo/keto reductase
MLQHEQAIQGDRDWEPSVVLKDGTSMPLVGLGTQNGWSEDGHNRGNSENAAEYVATALRTGFRLIDTARSYGSEAHVMRGIEVARLDRKNVFVVSKAWPGIDHAPGFHSSRSTIRESASRIAGYIDLYLVHHPVPGWQSLWEALEDGKDQGFVRSIGVSNFSPAHLEELGRLARHPPVANQILLHPFNYREQRQHYATARGMILRS